ncbi:MAG: hotdog fold thioesterase [Polyangiaceae bacterium]|nr:hotdog fold thioesterase [Polyangiaceae bacterium]
MVHLDVLRQLCEEFIPFNKWLGVKVEHIDRGHITLSIPWRPEFVGDPTVPALHGGVIAAVADAAGGVAVWTGLKNPASRLSTVDLRMDYLRPGREEKLIADAKVVRVGARLGWADVQCFHPSAETELVASARGVYAIKNPKQPRADG